MNTPMTSLGRTLETLSHREPDRVPAFLLLTMHGARELGLSMREYFTSPANVIEGQVRLRRKFGHDCYYAFCHASLEHEAFGGDTVYNEQGPANAGAPVLRSPEAIDSLEPPSIEGNPPLQRTLDIVRGLVEAAHGEVPVLGVVISPFSLPIMQLGFPAWLDLLHAALEEPAGARRAQLDRLLAINQSFCVRWANAQLAAGATAITYFDPMSSSTITTRELGVGFGMRLARQTIGQISGPVGIHFASGRILPILEDVVSTGAAVVGVSADEDLATLKARVGGRTSLLGNLNGIEMARWTPAEAKAAATRAILAAGPGGGFILADNHGEIPIQVKDEVLHAIVEAVRTAGAYPILASEAS